MRDTREKILDVAEALFAEKGFDGVSVREITNRAGCNISAINYYFKDKKGLYLEVFRLRCLPRAYMIRDAFRRYLKEDPGGGPRAVMRALIRAFLEGPLSDSERERQSLLMIREMTRPTKALDIIVEKAMKPFIEEVSEGLRPVMGESIDEQKMLLNLVSIFAMIMYFNFARIVVSRITGTKYTKDFRERLVDHILEFSLNGISGEGKS